jgi:hypothetical protein
MSNPPTTESASSSGDTSGLVTDQGPPMTPFC